MDIYVSQLLYYVCILIIHILKYIYIYIHIMGFLKWGIPKSPRALGWGAIGQVAWWLPNNAAMPINEFLGRQQGQNTPRAGEIQRKYSENPWKSNKPTPLSWSFYVCHVRNSWTTHWYPVIKHDEKSSIYNWRSQLATFDYPSPMLCHIVLACSISIYDPSIPQSANFQRIWHSSSKIFTRPSSASFLVKDKSAWKFHPTSLRCVSSSQVRIEKKKHVQHVQKKNTKVVIGWSSIHVIIDDWLWRAQSILDHELAKSVSKLIRIKVTLNHKDMSHCVWSIFGSPQNKMYVAVHGYFPFIAKKGCGCTH